jgi:nucleotide-binding universal stress UspA family protein
MQKILVPCDFSEQSVNAFRLAVDLADQTKGEVHVLHVIEVPVMHDSLLMPTLSFEASLLKELSDNAENQFKKLVADHPTQTPVIAKNVFGNISLMILDYITENRIELVVMGTKGASGLRELLIGSNAERIVRRSSCPVITVRTYEKLGNIKNIVVPNSLEDEQDDLVEHIKVLQGFLKATLHVVWINTPGNFTSDNITLTKMKDFAKRFVLTDYTLNIFNDTYEESGVISFAHMIKADMIAMGTHGRKGISHIMSGSLAEDVVNHIDCPIWTYTIKKARAHK